VPPIVTLVCSDDTVATPPTIKMSVKNLRRSGLRRMRTTLRPDNT